MNIIRNITSKGIEYKDQITNSVDFIDFEICNNNWIKYRKVKENLDDNEFIKLKARDLNVGQRDICAKPPYIKFFTKPNMTKIEFVNENEFRRISDIITEFGWRTLDMS